jgi:predicted MFS family arabinose efflux permease
MFGVFFFVSQYLEDDLHFSAIRAGFAFLPLTALIFGMSRITPRLVTRTGPRPLLLFGLVVLAGATLWISRATPTEGYWTSLFGPLLLFGLGAGSCFLPLSVGILTGVPRDDAGAASGMLQTMQQTGAALGVAALSSVAVSHGRRDAFEVGFVVIVVAFVLAAALVRPSRSRATELEAEGEMPLIALVE